MPDGVDMQKLEEFCKAILTENDCDSSLTQGNFCAPPPVSTSGEIAHEIFPEEMARDALISTIRGRKGAALCEWPWTVPYLT